MSSTRVFIGHLPYKAHESDVEKFFSRYGRIREILMKNGFGFVEFDDPRDAEEAVYKCNGKELRGERVIVEMTKRPPKGRDMYGRGDRGGGRGYGGDRGYGGRPNYNNRGSPPRRRDNDRPPSQTKYRVIVENLSSRVSWQDLKDVMRAAGEVTYADAHRIRQNEGIVCFSCAADLKKALDTLDGKEMNGRKIKLIDASRDSRRSRSRSKSKSRSRSGSRSRSRSSRRRSRSGSESSKSKSRSRSRSSEKSRSKSGSRSRSGSATVSKKTKDKSDSKKRSRTKSREKSHSRSASPDDKRRAGSRSASPDDKGRKSDVDD